jgi:F0F1-type ATP synthase assembly protein I
MTRSGSGYELLGLITQIGLNMVLTIGIASWAGYWLDNRLGIRPLFTLIGMVMGVFAAYRSTYSLLESFFKGEKKGDKDR